MSAILGAQGISVRYGDTVSLDRVSLEVAEGEVLAIIGPNGAGKSTLLRVLGCLERPDAGELYFRGKPITWNAGLLPLRRRMATVFAEPLLADTSVQANVAMGLRLRGIPAGEIQRRTRLWMARLGISGLADRSARTISSGEAQRTSLARALVLAPEVLFLDEPFSSLDQPAREALILDLDAILREERITTLFVTHDRSEALILGDRVAVMVGGRVLQVDVPGRLFAAPVSEEVARFVGVETVLPGRVLGEAEGLLTVEVAGQRVEVAGGARAGERVRLCFRPEDFTLSRPDEPAPHTSARNRLFGRVARLVSLGPLARVTVECGVPLVALVTRQSAKELGLAEGSPVAVTFKASAPHILRGPEHTQKTYTAT